jgi:RNA polymerase sigma factor (TIGR02999 family)
MSDRLEEVTTLLRSDLPEAERHERLLPLIYDELHGLARRRMASERTDHTLQPTALVHEAYMRLVKDRDMEWQGRRHFYGAAAEAMRRVLIDHARKVRAAKRGGEAERVTLGGAGLEVELDADQVLALDEALATLEAEDARAAEVVRLRYYTGLSVEETAGLLEVSERTVHREWTYARARLAELLGDA